MKMTRKKAADPNRGEYEIELPATRVVKEALLALDYSQGAIKIEEASRMLSEQFSLTDEQKNAKHKNGFKIFNQHVGNAAGVLVKNGRLVRPTPAFISLSDKTLSLFPPLIPNSNPNSAPGPVLGKSMKTIRKIAINPNTAEKYEIELPAHEAVQRAILEFDYPPGGIKIKETADALAQGFNLSEEEKSAKKKWGERYLNIFHYDVVAPIFKNLLREGKLEQPGGKGHPYVLAGRTPPPPGDESIEEIYQKLRKNLATELIQRINDNTPYFFEELVINLLVKMGYGGSREDAGKAVGGSSDGGIDGVINEARLGLDVVYVQAKRWETNVSRPEIQKFAGALQGQRARKGIFITTSDFTKDAREYVETIDSRIVLINGDQLAQFMIEHNVGVSTVKTYEIKRVDSDYFAENAE